MAPRKSSPATTGTGPLSAREKRAIRQKNRRQKEILKRPPGAKEKFVTGCFFVGVVIAIIFIVAYTHSCFTVE